MKRIGTLLLVLLCVGAVLLTAGCVNTNSQPDPAGTTWVLAGFGTDSDGAAAPAATISLTFRDSGNASGCGGVNSYSVSYTADPNTGSLSFGDAVVTLMAGPEQFMADETAYFTALANVTGYKLADETLVLTDKDGATLLIFTLPLENTAWAVVSYTAPGASDTTEPLALMTISFAENGTVFGSGGINQFTGTWTLDGTTLKITDIVSTKAAGAPALMAQEDDYFALLPGVSGFTFKMGSLILTDDGGNAVLTFRSMLADTTWELLSINGIVPPAAANTVTLQFESTGVLTGQAPINTYGGSWRATGIDTLVVSDVVTTLIASTSDEVNAYESQYYGILNNVSDYRIADGMLTLTDHNSNTMLFAVNVAEQLKGTEWVLASDSSITLVIGTDGGFSGQAPINVYSANAAFAKNQALSITGITATKMTGPADLVTSETSYLTTLGEVTGYNLVDGQLVLTGTGGTALLTYNQA